MFTHSLSTNIHICSHTHMRGRMLATRWLLVSRHSLLANKPGEAAQFLRTNPQSHHHYRVPLTFRTFEIRRRSAIYTHIR